LTHLPPPRLSSPVPPHSPPTFPLPLDWFKVPDQLHLLQDSKSGQPFFFVGQLWGLHPKKRATFFSKVTLPRSQFDSVCLEHDLGTMAFGGDAFFSLGFCKPAAAFFFSSTSFRRHRTPSPPPLLPKRSKHRFYPLRPSATPHFCFPTATDDLL